MEATLLEKPLTPRYAGRRMTKADFLAWDSDDAFVYEFDHGRLEPTKSMKQEEMYLLGNLEEFFIQTEAFRQGGRLRGEIDCWLTEDQMRRPDVAFFTKNQFQAAALGESVIPAFVVEIISEHDEILKGERKRSEYFAAGVRVVWWVLPPERTVYVYTSAKTAEICSGTDALHAAPVLPDLHLTAEDLFRL
jgi:Uma2 family endonuclease